MNMNDIFILRLFWYASVSLKDQYVIFGGTHHSNPLDGIFGYKNGGWTRLGTLKQARYQHSAISNGKEIMIVGGLTSEGLETEVWNVDFTHNRTIAPKLSGYHFYPELFLVPYDYLSSDQNPNRDINKTRCSFSRTNP